MSIKGIGIDLVEFTRIELAMRRSGADFAKELLNDNERNSEENWETSVPFIAERVAIKEAVAKALGTGLAGFHWHEIEVVKNTIGNPAACLLGRAYKIAYDQGIKHCLISTSYTSHYVIAQAIAVGKNKEPL